MPVYYEPNILTDCRYYPFGSVMPGRSYNSNSYRYGWNKGSEKDDEITGVSGSHYTTYFREIDTRLGRMWSRDPVFQPWQSPYTSMDNNPIFYNDPLGDDVKYKKFGDRVRVGLARLFSKKFNEDFKSKRDDNLNTFTYARENNNPRLRDATASMNLLDAPVDGHGTLANQYDIKYSFGSVGLGKEGGGFNLNLNIKFYPHEIGWDTEKTLRRPAENSGERITSQNANVGRLTRITFNTYQHPDQITISSQGEYIGGTEDDDGNNVSAVTRGNKYSVIDKRANEGGTVTLTIPNSTTIRGRVNVSVTTEATYQNEQTGEQVRNSSQWRVTLHGRRGIRIPLPWQKK